MFIPNIFLYILTQYSYVCIIFMIGFEYPYVLNLFYYEMK